MDSLIFSFVLKQFNLNRFLHVDLISNHFNSKKALSVRNIIQLNKSYTSQINELSYYCLATRTFE